MKNNRLFILAILLGFLGLNQGLNGQTKVFDQTFTWEYSPYEYGGYGFYWWHRTDGGVNNINYGNMPSDNWLSPNNYYGGEWTLSIEVISQPSNEPFYIQFGIWGDYWKGTSHTETVAGRQWVSGGAGSSGSYSLGSPSGWWQKQPSDPLDFSRANDFYRIGVVLWDGASTCIPMGHDWNPDGCPENAWKYFPMTVKISVYANTGTYVPPPPPPPPVTAPDYGIDYWGERTDKAVSSEDQYSYNGDFNPVYDGSGAYLDLTPGTDVYFRKKADWSKKQTLSVPSRPAAPTFGIDYPNERTSETVGDSYKYSGNSDLSSPTTGDGSYVSLNPGSNIYLRKNANSSAFASVIQELIVPARPGVPTFGIDYTNERTSSTVGSSFHYSGSPDMSGAESGTGDHVAVPPGSAVYFRQMATASAFRSNIQALVAPDRPVAPVFQIDYEQEAISSPISSAYIYGSNSDLSDAVQGTDNVLGLTPGEIIYIQKKATGSAYASETQMLVSPSRPEAPAFGLDFENETTDMVVTSGHQYSVTSGFESSTEGTGVAVPVIPGTDLYFRSKATASSYTSDISHLAVPQRPVVSSTESGSTTQYPFIASFTFSQEIDALEASGITVVNAELNNITVNSSGSQSTVFQGLVYATARDNISILIPANAVAEGNFASSSFNITYTGQLPGGVGIETMSAKGFNVFPNPGKGVFHMNLEDFDPDASYRVELCTIAGKVVHSQLYSGLEQIQLEYSGFARGLYLLRLIENESIRGVSKLMIE